MECQALQDAILLSYRQDFEKHTRNTGTLELPKNYVMYVKHAKLWSIPSMY